MQIQSDLATLCIAMLAVITPQANDVLENLGSAKSTHQASVATVSEDYRAWLTKRKAESRKKGAINEVRKFEKLENDFENTAEIPPTAPDSVRQKLLRAHTALETAYASTIRELTRQARDAQIVDIERQQQEFIAGTTASKPVVDIQYARKRHFPDTFSTDGRVLGNDVIFDGRKFEKALFAHPSENDFSEVVYNIDGDWDRLSGQIGILRSPKLPDDVQSVRTTLTFEIIADGKRVWASDVRDYNKLKGFEISVRKVQELQFRIQCPGSNYAAWAVWLEPTLTRRK